MALGIKRTPDINKGNSLRKRIALRSLLSGANRGGKASQIELIKNQDKHTHNIDSQTEVVPWPLALDQVQSRYHAEKTDREDEKNWRCG